MRETRPSIRGVSLALRYLVLKDFHQSVAPGRIWHKEYALFVGGDQMRRELWRRFCNTSVVRCLQAVRNIGVEAMAHIAHWRLRVRSSGLLIGRSAVRHNAPWWDQNQASPRILRPTLARRGRHVLFLLPSVRGPSVVVVRCPPAVVVRSPSVVVRSPSVHPCPQRVPRPFVRLSLWPSISVQVSLAASRRSRAQASTKSADARRSRCLYQLSP